MRAEVIGWQELVEAGSFAHARELGRLRTEGRDYVVADGDVLTIKFTNRALSQRRRPPTDGGPGAQPATTR